MGYIWTKNERMMYDFVSTSQLHAGDNVVISGEKFTFLETEEEDDGLRVWYRCISLMWFGSNGQNYGVVYVGVSSSDDGSEIMMYDESSPLGKFLSEE